MDAVLGILGILLIIAAVICIIVFGIILIVKAAKKRPKKSMFIALGSSAAGLILGIILINVGYNMSINAGADPNLSTTDSSTAPTTADTGSSSSSNYNPSDSSSGTNSSASGSSDSSNTVNHNVNWSVDMNGVKFSIDQVYIVKKHLDSADGSGTGYDGAIVVHMTIDNKSSKDITTFPSQGTILTSTGQQADADTADGDSFDGDIMSGGTQNGKILFPIKSLSDPNSIKNVRIHWQLWPDKNDTTNASDVDARISF